MNLPFAIGDRVQVNALATLVYDDNGNRHVHRGDTSKVELIGHIVGASRRRVGRYVPAPRPFSNDDLDGNGPCLKVTGTVLLYQVRFSMCGKIKEALESDLRIV